MDRSIINKLSFSFVAQLFSIFVSLIFSLGITKVLDIEHYGYWQLFILYSSYAGFFHFGICDGIYLKLGGRKLKRLNQFNFTNQLVFFVAIQFIISIVFIAFLFATTSNPIKFELLLFIGPYLIIANLQTYLSYVLLATNQIESYSKSVLIEKLFITIALAVAYFLGIIVVSLLIYVYLIGKLLSLLFLVYQVKPLIVTKGLYSFRKINYKILFTYAIIGIPLMFSNILSTLLIGSNRLLTENKYGIIAFSKLSFSISLVFLFIIFVSQIGVVLFPMLRKMSHDNRKLIFQWINNNLTLLFICSMIFYFPLVLFVKKYVPQYFESTLYLSVLLPICVFEGKFQILHNTMYKVLNKQKTIFVINVISLVLCVLLTYISLYIFDSISYSIYMLVIVIGVRSIFSELVLCSFFKIRNYRSIFESVIISVIFVFINSCFSFLISLLIYFFILFIYILTKYLLKEISFKLKQ